MKTKGTNLAILADLQVGFAANIERAEAGSDGGLCSHIAVPQMTKW